MSDEPIKHEGIRDTRMLKRALEQRWPIDPEHRQSIMDRMVLIATDDESSDRHAISAAKTVIAADKINIDDEQGPSDHKHLHLHGDGKLIDFDELLSDRSGETNKVERLLSQSENDHHKNGNGKT